ncbi:MAG: site-specific integrase, partial [Elusimicrobiota bacterium]
MRLLIDRFLLHLKVQRNFARNTIKAYQFDLSVFNAYAAAAMVDAPNIMDRLLMRGYIASISDRKVSRNTLLRKISAVRSFIHYLLETGQIETDPFDLITIPKKEKRLPRFMTEGEVEKLQDYNRPEEVNAREKN